MAQYKSEYTNSMVGSPGCAYKTSCSSGGPIMTHLSGDPIMTHLSGDPTMTHLRRPGTTSGVFLTPDYAGIGYDALTHGVSSGCQQYFNIQDAYGSGAGNCMTSYTSRACGGCNGGAVGKGMDWVCSTGKCVGVHKGAQRPPGDVYRTKHQCQSNCKPMPGEGMDWVCSTSQLGGGKCVGVHKGTHPYPPGVKYPTSYQCHENCKPGQHR
uniref:Uncharacterized protein n=1 Tax=viral metagenome TaxID=1070528 RepID=A0A6C0JMP9_9ZZZZ